MINKDLLRRIRNDLPMRVVIAMLGADGPPSKIRDGRFVFLCPHCGDMQATVNPRNNLAHCFGCNKNLNTIDLLMTLGYNFVSAVAINHDCRTPLRRLRQNSLTWQEHAKSRHAWLLQNSQQFGNQASEHAKSLQRQFGYNCDHNSVGDSSSRRSDRRLELPILLSVFRSRFR